MSRRYCYKDVLPCTAMVAVECANVVLNILFKAASLKGLSYYVFVTYCFALANLVLLPLALFLIRKTGLPPFKFSLISRLCLIGFLGFSGQLCTNKGLELGTPTLSSAISNLTPAFTFILAVFFRMENVVLRSLSTRAKIIGTIASISGASVVVLYKGPKVLYPPKWTSSSALLLQQPLESPQSNWVVGGLLLVVGYFFYSFWYIVQSQVMRIYPEEVIVIFISNLVVFILSILVCLLAEPNITDWRLRPAIVTASILYSGIFTVPFTGTVHAWGVRLKGPVYVATFRPLSIVIAAVMSSVFLGDALYLGSVIGALILSAGLYAVLWGKTKEEMTYYDSCSSSGPVSNCKVSLLKSHSDEEM